MRRLLLVSLVLVTLLVTAVPIAASPAAAGVIHIVQPGQTLFSIARLYGLDMWTIARANGIVNPNLIYVGQRLTIPSAPVPQPPVVVGDVYVVQRGDTLYGIAARFRTTAWAIAQLNGIRNINAIYVGQRLRIPGLAPRPQPQPVTTGWHGEYYDGTDLEGGVLFTRTDRAINFHWGLTSPDTRLNTDEFSVRWTRSITFKGGLYRFVVVADDGVVLYIDSDPVLDEWDVQPETTHTVEVVLEPGQHTVTLEYFEDTGVATAQLTFTRLGDAPEDDSDEDEDEDTDDDEEAEEVSAAWYSQFYGNTTLSGAVLLSRYDAAIGFEWGGGSPGGAVPADKFSARFTRTAQFATDNYRFCAMSDDGVRIYVGGKLIVNEWHASNGLNYCGTADLTQGVHEVKVEYYDDGGMATLYIWWERW